MAAKATLGSVPVLSAHDTDLIFSPAFFSSALLSLLHSNFLAFLEQSWGVPHRELLPDASIHFSSCQCDHILGMLPGSTPWKSSLAEVTALWQAQRAYPLPMPSCFHGYHSALSAGFTKDSLQPGSIQDLFKSLQTSYFKRAEGAICLPLLRTYYWSFISPVIMSKEAVGTWGSVSSHR